jgi:hypothetical protein
VLGYRLLFITRGSVAGTWTRPALTTWKLRVLAGVGQEQSRKDRRLEMAAKASGVRLLVVTITDEARARLDRIGAPTQRLLVGHRVQHNGNDPGPWLIGPPRTGHSHRRLPGLGTPPLSHTRSPAEIATTVGQVLAQVAAAAGDCRTTDAEEITAITEAICGSSPVFRCGRTAN